MDSWTKAKEWVNENVPMLSVVYQNKYVGMVWDRFASLPAKQQKQVLLGVFASFVGAVVLFLAYSYYSLWSYSSSAKESSEMISLLQQYEKQRRDKSSQIQSLDRNSQLEPSGQFKQHLLTQAKNSGISPRMVQITEKSDGEEAGHEVKLKQATVVLDKINLQQLKDFLSSVEFGQYDLSISSLKVTNDSKIRGYMRVELGIVAYLFQNEEEG